VIDRKQEVPHEGPMCDLLWSDPDGKSPERQRGRAKRKWSSLLDLDLLIALQQNKADIRYSRMGNVTSRSRVLIRNRCSRGKLVHLRVGMIADK
jgi:hypothetical protein